MSEQNKGRIVPSIAKRAKLFLEDEKRLGITRPTKSFKIQEGI